MFFTEINRMMTEGVDITLVIRKSGGQMIVSALPKANGLKDEAQNRIIPLTMTGAPEEMDDGFLLPEQMIHILLGFHHGDSTVLLPMGLL